MFHRSVDHTNTIEFSYRKKNRDDENIWHVTDIYLTRKSNQIHSTINGKYTKTVVVIWRKTHDKDFSYD